MRVMGVDPGLTRCGVGVVEGAPGRPLTLVDVVVVRTPHEAPLEERLAAGAAAVRIRDFTPDMALELRLARASA